MGVLRILPGIPLFLDVDPVRDHEFLVLWVVWGSGGAWDEGVGCLV